MGFTIQGLAYIPVTNNILKKFTVNWIVLVSATSGLSSLPTAPLLRSSSSSVGKSI